MSNSWPSNQPARMKTILWYWLPCQGWCWSQTRAHLEGLRLTYYLSLLLCMPPARWSPSAHSIISFFRGHCEKLGSSFCHITLKLPNSHSFQNWRCGSMLFVLVAASWLLNCSIHRVIYVALHWLKVPRFSFFFITLFVSPHMLSHRYVGMIGRTESCRRLFKYI